MSSFEEEFIQAQ